MKKIKVSNAAAGFITLYLESWGEDYGMLPGDEFEVIAADAEENFCFHISHLEKDISIWCEGDTHSVGVYQAGKLLSCGHNRRESLQNKCFPFSWAIYDFKNRRETD